MHLKDALASSLQTIISHKFRSFLTLLGIIIGVTSVVAMFSSVNGVKMIMDERMSKLGWDNTLIITPGTSNRNTMARGMYFITQTRTASKKAKPLSYSDFEALQAEIDAKYKYGMIEAWFEKQNTAPLSNRGGVIMTSHTGRSMNRIRATNIDYFEQNSYPIKRGRFFNSFEMSRAEKVCIVGPKFSIEDFGGEDPLDQYYTAGNHRFKIIGILDEDILGSDSGFLEFNSWQRNWELQAIYIPLKTGAVYLRQNMALDNITLQAHDADSYQDMQNRVNQVLLARHNMEKDFSFQDIGAQVLEMLTEIEEMMKKWSITLLVIATVSLVVGGIGLFSTLLISINERMMEIGVRKSIGAKDSDIFFYFIMEAITLSFIASSIGIILGILITMGLGLAIKTQVPISIVSFYIGFGFALVIGFLSGLYPALRAAGINPIQAIYYFE